MSVFTKEAFQMSAMPSPASTAPNSALPSRRGSVAGGASGMSTPALDNSHIVEINVDACLFDMDGEYLGLSGI